MFVTFTYDDEHLPKSRDVALNNVRAFVKAFSRHFVKKPRYYIVSETGDLNGRFHFHGLLFGVDISKNPYYEKDISKLWSNGFIQCSIANPKDYRYVTKYVTKDADPYKNVSDFEGIQTFSKRPSLGFNWFKQSHRAYFNSDLSNSLYIDGIRYSLPRSFSSKIYTDDNIIRKKYMSLNIDPFDPLHEDDVYRKYDIKIRSAKRKKLLNYAKSDAIKN